VALRPALRDPLDTLQPTSETPQQSCGALWRAGLVIVAIYFVTCAVGIGSTALWDPDEPRFAEATRQMLLRGDFVTPWFNEAPRFEKPILFYWLQLPFFATLGATETAARAPAVLAGLAAVLGIFGLGRDLVSTRAGLLAAAVLATTFRFVLYARQGLTDIPVVAAVTLAIWAMSRAITERSGPAAARGAWALVGAAILLKGPVGLLAPMIWTAWAAIAGGRDAIRRTRPVSGVLIAILIAGPWYGAMVFLHGRAFVDTALGYEILARYLSADFPGRDRGVLYFWRVWLGDGAPWSLFLPPALWWGYAYRARLAGGERQVLLLAVIWFVTVLLVCSASQYKLPHYILPAYPAMALAVGIFGSAAIDGRVPGTAWRVPTYLTALAMAACAALLWPLLVRVFGLRPPDPAFGLVLLLAGGAVVVAIVAARGSATRAGSMFAAVAVTLALTYGLLGSVVAPRELQRFQPMPRLGQTARNLVQADEPFAVAGLASGLVFYSRHPVRQLRDRTELVAFLSGEGRRHCVMTESEWRTVSPLVNRRLHVQARANLFSVRMRRLLEDEPERAGIILVLVTAE